MNSKLPWSTRDQLTKSTKVTFLIAILGNAVNRNMSWSYSSVSLGKPQTNLQLLLSMGESSLGQLVGFLNALDVSACIFYRPTFYIIVKHIDQGTLEHKIIFTEQL